MAKHYDLIVIGSGPGGLRGAIQASKLGKKVLLVEKDKLGGASVHTGTIPSKSLREAALSPVNESFSSAMKRMQKVVSAESKLLKAQLESNEIEIEKGRGTFIDKNTLSVNDRKFTADYFMIATGARPIRHPEFPWPLVLDSDAILRLKKLPKELLILGAGVIGCEYASIFARLGSKVTLADRRAELLRNVDEEIVSCLRDEFKSQKIQLLMSCDYKNVKKASGSTKLEVLLGKKKKAFDAVLVCMGRTPNIESLNIDPLGIQKDSRGNIKVNENYQTTAPHIYAVGDVVGPPGLAASSSEQGRIAACRIFQSPCAAFPPSFPYGIYTIPEISSVGAQEFELKEKHVSYVVGKADFSEVARGLIVNERGFIKILVNRENRKILGVHAIGSGATELIHIGQAIFALQAPIDYLVDNVFNYPTFAEAYKVAALNAVNKIRTNTQ